MAPSLRTIFPVTHRQLQENKFLLIEAEFLGNFQIPQDVGYFPMLLKKKNFSEAIIQIADFEYLQWQVSGSEELTLRSGGPYAINSTLQWLVVESAAPILNRSQGLYAFWKFQGQIFEKILSSEEAEKIQGIQEHPELMPLEPENQILSQLIALGMIKQTSSDS